MAMAGMVLPLWRWRTRQRWGSGRAVRNDEAAEPSIELTAGRCREADEGRARALVDAHRIAGCSFGRQRRGCWWRRSGWWRWIVVWKVSTEELFLQPVAAFAVGVAVHSDIPHCPAAVLPTVIPWRAAEDGVVDAEEDRRRRYPVGQALFWRHASLPYAAVLQAAGWVHDVRQNGAGSALGSLSIGFPSLTSAEVNTWSLSRVRYRLHHLPSRQVRRRPCATVFRRRGSRPARNTDARLARCVTRACGLSYPPRLPPAPPSPPPLRSRLPERRRPSPLRLDRPADAAVDRIAPHPARSRHCRAGRLPRACAARVATVHCFRWLRQRFRGDRMDHGSSWPDPTAP